MTIITKRVASGITKNNTKRVPMQGAASGSLGTDTWGGTWGRFLTSNSAWGDTWLNPTPTVAGHPSVDVTARVPSGITENTTKRI